MTDPNNPSAPQPPAYQPPAYPTSSSDASYGNPNAPIPGKTLSIVAFVLSFFAQLVALVLGIVALVQSKKAGHKNGFALAAIIISSVLMVIGVVVAIVLFTVFGNMANEIYQTCVVEGADTVTVWGQTQPCSSARY